MSFTVIIPARYQSSRFPGKVLAELAGKTVLQHVYEQAQRSQADDIVIATDDERIAAAAEAFAARVCMTSAEHPTGTDRLAETVSLLGLSADATVVNVQGDGPFLPPEYINQVAQTLQGDTTASMASLCHPLRHIDDMLNPQYVKVVLNQQQQALYFSRAPIPWHRDQFAVDMQATPTISAYGHIGIYAYRAGFLQTFVNWQPSPLEQIEYLEQLRVLHHGHTIAMNVVALERMVDINTPDDLVEAQQFV